jgi:hypothetical protein
MPGGGGGGGGGDWAKDAALTNTAATNTKPATARINRPLSSFVLVLC